jgi:glycine/D-amino acid oxidase-like deaminating enzyme
VHRSEDHAHGARPGSREAAQAALVARVREVLPGLTWEAEGPVWAGVRPMAPDSLPIVGPLPVTPLRDSGPSNVYLNCGHGANGWTMCCATAAILAGIVARREGRPLAPGQRPLDFLPNCGPTLEAVCSPSRFWMSRWLSWLL